MIEPFKVILIVPESDVGSTENVGRYKLHSVTHLKSLLRWQNTKKDNRYLYIINYINPITIAKIRSRADESYWRCTFLTVILFWYVLRWRSKSFSVRGKTNESTLIKLYLKWARMERKKSCKNCLSPSLKSFVTTESLNPRTTSPNKERHWYFLVNCDFIWNDVKRIHFYHKKLKK